MSVCELVTPSIWRLDDDFYLAFLQPCVCGIGCGPACGCGYRCDIRIEVRAKNKHHAIDKFRKKMKLPKQIQLKINIKNL